MAEALGVVLFAVIILVSVCLHEAGHMLTAKAFGMKVTRYFAGFGPTLWSFKKGETEYGVKAIPLGGFVKIVGMTPQDDDVEPGDEDRAMWRFPVWKRTIVMSAGSVTHFIIGLGLLWIIFAFLATPSPQASAFDSATASTSQINAYPSYVEVDKVCLPATATGTCTGNNSPAYKAGLRTGDRITGITYDGGGSAISNYGQLVDAVRSSPTSQVTISYVRAGQPSSAQVDLLSVSRPPEDDPNGTPTQVYALGVLPTLAPGTPTTVKYGAIGGISHAFTTFGDSFSEIGSALKSLPGKIPGLVDAISGKPRDANGPVSVVGASEIGGQAVQHGQWAEFLALAASLNLFVGVFNLFPLLPLDGGHIAIAWYEKVRSWFARMRRRPEPDRVNYFKLMPLTYGVIVVLGGFSLLTILADIVNPINIFGK
jgi:membrane-associated protease RseP (regulator of RpoE activity)